MITRFKSCSLQQLFRVLEVDVLKGILPVVSAGLHVVITCHITFFTSTAPSRSSRSSIAVPFAAGAHHVNGEVRARLPHQEQIHTLSSLFTIRTLFTILLLSLIVHARVIDVNILVVVIFVGATVGCALMFGLTAFINIAHFRMFLCSNCKN